MANCSEETERSAHFDVLQEGHAQPTDKKKSSPSVRERARKFELAEDTSDEQAVEKSPSSELDRTRKIKIFQDNGDRQTDETTSTPSVRERAKKFAQGDSDEQTEEKSSSPSVREESRKFELSQGDSDEQTNKKSSSPSVLERTRKFEIFQDNRDQQTDPVMTSPSATEKLAKFNKNQDSLSDILPSTSGYLEQRYMADLKRLLNFLGLDLSTKLSARDGRTLKLLPSLETEGRDIVFQFFTHLSAMDHHAIEKLPSTVQYQQGSERSSRPINKKDILFAIVSCCDQFLLQDVLSKLHSIGSAVPILGPCINSPEKRLLCHGLWKCFYHRVNPNTGTTERIQLVDEEVLCVSAMRIGNIEFSKSSVLNALLSKLQNIEYKSFYITSVKDPPGSWWSTGTVEAVWYMSDQTSNDRLIPSFLLLNARGDVDINGNLQDLFACMCNISIIFVAKEVPESRLQQLMSAFALPSTIVLICENTLKDTLASQSTVILNYGKSSLGEITEHLAKILQDPKNNHSRNSVRNFTQHCKRLGIRRDGSEFDNLKRVAQETAHSLPFPLTDNAESILPLSKYPKQNDVSGDFLNEDTTRNPKRNASPGKSMALSKFLKSTMYGNNERQIFFSYLHSFLERKCFGNVISAVDYYKTYFVRRTKKLKDSNELTSKVQEDWESDCSNRSESSKVVEKNVLSVEDFLYELMLITESTNTSVSPNFDMSEFSHCLATWMLNGNSINLINFDSPHSPFAFAQAVLSGLYSLLGDTAFVRVLSIFGGNWEATCLMLDRMFGASITTSEAMCSKGPRIHLFPVKMKTDGPVNFGYLLVILVGTHSSFKITQSMYLKRRNQVLELISLLTDVLILHVDKDDPQPEETTAFDMVVQCLLNRTDKVLHKCCIVYNLKNTLQTSLDDLTSYTYLKLQQSYASARGMNSTYKLEDRSEESVFVSNVWSYFKSYSMVNLKYLPTLRYNMKIQTENEYLNRLYDLRNIILQTLKECFSVPHSFKNITEIIALQNNYLKGTETFNTELAQGHDETRDKKQNNMQENSYVQSNVSNSSINKSNKPQSGSFQSDKTLGHKSDAPETRINIDDAIELVSQSFEVRLKTMMKESYSSKLETKQLEACSIQHSVSLGKRYPIRKIHEVKSWTRNVITNKLKKAKYGKAVNKIVTEGLRDDLHDLTVLVESMEDIRVLENQFNNVLEKDKKALIDCQTNLEKLSCDYAQFEKSANEMMLVLKDHLKGFSVSVNKLTMSIFLCIKFVFKIHRHHVNADLKRADTTAIKSVTDIGTYIIKYEEPLRFQSLDKKIEWIIPLLKSMFAEDEFSQVLKHLTSDNAVNYIHIPFHMQTLQRLDRKLLQLLPIVSSKNMNHILGAVNEAKSYLLGKMLGKAPYNFDESFDYVFNLITSTFTDGSKSETIKATAFVHVFAWSSALISVKIHQSENENSIPRLFEKLLPIFKFNCKIYAKEKCQEQFCNTVYNAVRETLMEYIPQELENQLKRSLLHNHRVISYKKSFITYMLSTFCQDNDFLSLLKFVENYENCSERWVLLFLAERINASTDSMIAKIKIDVIKRTISNVIAMVKETTSACVRRKDETLFSWIQLFHKYLNESNRKIFKRLDQQLKFHDINLFCNRFCATVKQLEDCLYKKIELPEEGNMDGTKTWLFSLPYDMYDELSRNVLGCKEQCPTCGNVCDYSLATHSSHSAFCHIPIGIKGGTVRTGNRLSSLTCTDLMSYENVLTPLELEGHTMMVNFSIFLNEKHHKWDIPFDESNRGMFWKYIFNRFNKQFSQHYECEEGKVPSEWKKISKKEAIESISESYSAVSKEIE